MNIETLKNDRRALAYAIGKLSPLEGKTIKQLGANQLDTVKTAIARAQAIGKIMPQHVQGTRNGAPIIDLSSARSELQTTESEIHSLDSLESSPALEEYQTAMAQALAALAQLREESGINNPAFYAYRYGYVNGSITF